MFTIVAMYVTMTSNSDYGWILTVDWPSLVGTSLFTCPVVNIVVRICFNFSTVGSK